MRVVKLTDYTAEKVRSICATTGELRAQWSNPEQRREIMIKLSERGIDFPTLAYQAGKPDADPFELQLQLSQLRNVVSSRAAATVLAENYVGLEAV